LTGRVEGDGAVPFEARVENVGNGIRWSASDLEPPLLMQAAKLFENGLSVRAAARALNIGNGTAGRLRQQAVADGLLSLGDETGGSEAFVQ
jgi:hypothetical protein